MPLLISGRTPLTPLRLACLALAGLLVAAGAALAAPCADGDCCNAPGDFARHEPSLSVRAVDFAEADHADAAGADTAAPLLYLTPRVASILEQVFGDDGGAAAETEEPVSLPPVAQQDAERYDPSLPADAATPPLPKFQRQMYRTDI